MPNLVIVGPGGIGRAIAREHSARGWGITLVGRSAERLAVAAAECPGANTFVTDPTDVDTLPTCAPTLQEFRPNGFHAVVCSVGSVALQPAHRINGASWRAVMAANLDAAFATLRLAVELLPQGGSVLLFYCDGTKPHLLIFQWCRPYWLGESRCYRRCESWYRRFSARFGSDLCAA